MTDRMRLLLALVGPPSLWAFHFVAAYALISASCAPRALLGTGSAFAIMIPLTLAAVGLSLLAAARPPPDASDELTRAVRWLGIVSAAAVLFNLLPFLLNAGCG